MHKGLFAFSAAILILANRSISVAEVSTKTYLKACITHSIFLDTSLSWIHLSFLLSIVPSVISTSMSVAYLLSIGNRPLPI